MRRMALSDSMEMPSIAGRTPGPIAVFSHSYARLPEHFFARLAPTPVAKPHLIKLNDSLASELGVNTQGLDPGGLPAVFAGNVTPPGAEPIAVAYAGHQFGNFAPRLGDGCAILLGEVLDRNGDDAMSSCWPPTWSASAGWPRRTRLALWRGFERCEAT